jgi:hypothetical protein
MTTLKKVASRIGGVALVAAAVGLTAGLAPASAAPTPTPGHNLYIYPDPASSGNYRVTVKGVFPMGEYEAHGYINNILTGERPGGIEYNIHADDPDADPRIRGEFFPGAGKGPGPGHLVAEADGIHYLREFVVPFDALNEDDGLFDDTDEIFVYVRFIDAASDVRRAYTNALSGTYGGNY